MAFTTQIFLFVFFPFSIILYYLMYFSGRINTKISKVINKFRVTDICLIIISMIFYMWTCFDDLFRFLIYIVCIYISGTIISRARNKYLYITGSRKETEENEKQFISISLLILFCTIWVMIYVLVHFKYTSLTTSVWNFLFKDLLEAKTIIAPLGISFITFSAISYIADIYMGKAVAGNIIDCMLYLLFFPKVVSGPIVLWRDYCKQIYEKEIHIENISNGISRIMIGFAKKTILADTFGTCIASVGDIIDVPTAWGVALLYMLQIYYDFSGYSDIAIGLSSILGFDFKENFNFPYLSCSITEFWRRWHISLGTWFREYIYFPLGGSRKGKRRTIINIAIVFLLTGIWHGAGWTYMLWGILNGVCNIIEKMLSDKKIYQEIPKLLKWMMTMAITFFAWELFRFTDFQACKEWFATMFGLRTFETIPYTWQYYFDIRMIIFMIIGILGSTVLGLNNVQKIYLKLTNTKIGYLVNEIIYMALFVIAIMFMINSKYSPFIYFQY